MKATNRRKFLQRGTAYFAASGLIASSAIAQTKFPNRPLTLIVPAPAGSRTGVAARLFAGHLEHDLGQPIRVVNPDGTSAQGHAALAAAPADGYTLGVLPADVAIMHWRGLTQLKPADFTALALFAEDPAAIHVHADAPWQTAKQFIDHLRANSGKLRVSSTPKGGIWHLSTVGLLSALGLGPEAMPWTPSANPVEALEDLSVAGLEVVVCSVPEVRGTAGARTSKTLAVMANKRSPRFGDVPTLQEATGIRYTSGNWRGLAGPKGLPAEVATIVTTAAKKTWANKEFQTAMNNRGFGLVWAGLKEFDRFIGASDEKLGDAVKAAGMLAS